jgi:hypothetical protein
MQAFTQINAPASGIIGVEPMPLVTHSVSLNANQGSLKAGTFIDAAGAKATTIANTFGVLAFDTETHATDQIGQTVYTSGSFVETKIKAANSEITFDQAAEDALRAKNIYLERSVG